MDPRITAPQNRQANLSPLMRAKGQASLGQKVNVCPFGCQEEDLDDHGYCDHLVGFTLPGDERKMEPMVKNEKGTRVVDGTAPRAVPKGAKLVQITVSSRVYVQLEEEKKGAA